MVSLKKRMYGILLSFLGKSRVFLFFDIFFSSSNVNFSSQFCFFVRGCDRNIITEVLALIPLIYDV